MDSARFDNITRLFGAGASRRQMLRGLLAGAGALAVTGASGRLVGAQICQGYGDPCQSEGGEGNECCEGFVCSSDDPAVGACVCEGSLTYCEATNTCIDVGIQCCDDADCESTPCSSCVGNTCTPYAEYCPGEPGYCYERMEGECCTSEDCGEEECVDGHCCPPGYSFCPDGQYCYTQSVGGCCTDDQCPNGACVDEVCTECPEGEQFCDDGDYCYSTMTGACCSDNECGEGEECIDRHCCPPGYDYCPDGDYCYTERVGECCTDEQCGDGVCVDKVCQECPTGQSYCESGKYCYDPTTECCTDSDCGPCAFCSELNATCYGECSQSQSCCNDVCVENEVGCCHAFGETCGVLEVTSAGGDDRQYDCCDGLLCCFGQATNVCGECCADSDCNAAWGGVCNNFICEYPTCEGKWEACNADSDCCHGLQCHGGVCKHRKHHHHPKPKPTPNQPVTTLPATGSGNDKDDSSTALGLTLATGAAAVLAAKYLRQNSADEAAEEA